MPDGASDSDHADGVVLVHGEDDKELAELFGDSDSDHADGVVLVHGEADDDKELAELFGDSDSDHADGVVPVHDHGEACEARHGFISKPNHKLFWSSWLAEFFGPMAAASG